MAAITPARHERRLQAIQQKTHQERQQLLEQISRLLEKPMMLLSFAWLVIIVLDLMGYNPRVLDTLTWILWGIFLVHFLLEFIIAPP
ncbi:MAG TPA: hypothetical protein VFB38_26710 [Chthonomonadaceae bacterium]|nr:hypothetical protein [Chthonomonadaceae bacterium]